MDQSTEIKEFTEKFQTLSIENQNYIIAIQQALIFAQSSEEKQKSEGKREQQK